MSPITTHVLDTALGRPAAGVAVALAFRPFQGDWFELATGVTDLDGRCRNLLADDAPVELGDYRLTFQSGAYFRAGDRPDFFPEVAVVFRIEGPAGHHHVPLLLNPFGYSTYRGADPSVWPLIRLDRAGGMG